MHVIDGLNYFDRAAGKNKSNATQYTVGKCMLAQKQSELYYTTDCVYVILFIIIISYWYMIFPKVTNLRTTLINILQGVMHPL